MRTRECTEFRKIGEFWFPIVCRWASEEHIPSVLLVVDPASVKINETLDDASYEVKFPAGKLVADPETQVICRDGVPVNVETEKSIPKKSYWWIYSIVGIVFGAILIFFGRTISRQKHLMIAFCLVGVSSFTGCPSVRTDVSTQLHVSKTNKSQQILEFPDGREHTIQEELPVASNPTVHFNSGADVCFDSRHPASHGDPVEPAFPKLFQEAAPVDLRPKGTSTGRRSKLVERQHHFGRGIVRSANNFGQLGDPPTHPELLDFLSQQLVRSDWRLKPLHRMMRLSQTYRLSSTASNEAVQKDPSNDLFARFNIRRLSAEELRDAVLTVNHRINWKQSGPSFYPDVSDDVKAGQSVPGSGWGKSTEAERARRSVYIHIKRSLIPPELMVRLDPFRLANCDNPKLLSKP